MYVWQGKGKLNKDNDSAVDVEKKTKKKYSYIEPVTTETLYNFNSHEFDFQYKKYIDKVVSIKLNEGHIFGDAAVTSSYDINMKTQLSLSGIDQNPALLEFLREVVEPDLEYLSLWAGLYPIKKGFQKKKII